MRWLHDWRRGWAIKSYARRLPRLLVKDYGGSDAYTPAQILASIRRHRLNANFEGYAVAMFSDRERFEQFRAEQGEPRDYDKLREDAAVTYFGVDSDFAAMNFLSDSSFAEGSGSDHGAGELGGHHSH